MLESIGVAGPAAVARPVRCGIEALLSHQEIEAVYVGDIAPNL